MTGVALVPRKDVFEIDRRPPHALTIAGIPFSIAALDKLQRQLLPKEDLNSMRILRICLLQVNFDPDVQGAPGHTSV